ncbi:hypothetical protein [Escherichia phage vB-Eco-KMB46]|nr:hypothetical protein G3B1_076 [Escherichia phage vB_EcoS-G3B1]WQN06675.1 hypothetical protein [Escherichia phage vB-Eco-KMB46]
MILFMLYLRYFIQICELLAPLNTFYAMMMVCYWLQ